MKPFRLAAAAFAVAAANPAAAGAAATPAPAAAIALPGGTTARDVRPGTGAQAVPGRRVAVQYTGWLYTDGGRGRQFDSSRDRGEPFVFTLGAGEVIAGWDEGVAGMKAGGRRTLIIPPAAGYGDRGAGTDIPPGATLIFDIELVAVEGS